MHGILRRPWQICSGRAIEQTAALNKQRSIARSMQTYRRRRPTTKKLFLLLLIVSTELINHQLLISNEKQTCWAFGQSVLGHFGDVSEVFVTGVAKVRRAEAEEHGHRATVTALVLQVVGSVTGAHLGPGYVTAPATHQFARIESFSSTSGATTCILRT